MPRFLTGDFAPLAAFPEEGVFRADVNSILGRPALAVLGRAGAGHLLYFTARPMLSGMARAGGIASRIGTQVIDSCGLLIPEIRRRISGAGH